MNNFSFLNLNEIQKEELQIIERSGMKSATTDFSILLGINYSNEDFTIGCKSLENRTGEYWASNLTEKNLVKTVTFMGTIRERNTNYRNIGARLLINYEDITNILKYKDFYGITKIEYGYYPQMAASINIQEELETAYINEKLEYSGNIYTVDDTKTEDENKPFSPIALEEYEYKGKSYVRARANSNNSKVVLSNGMVYYNNDYVWIEVKPIVWLVDEKTKTMLTEKILFAGIRYNEKCADFNQTEIKKFINEYWSKEIMQKESNECKMASEYKTETINKQENEIFRKQNPYGFKFGEVSEEDIIRGALQSNISVFLHGRSSEGKSARVKQFDPECEILYLRNLTPEGLNGKTVYNQVTGDLIDIKPTWLQKLEEKCEREKDKIHIVFLDEITNALPSIQGMAFNIVLDREVNGKWKLPENARIAAAGNDMGDSISANELSEPLFNRFAHVYIETTAQEQMNYQSHYLIDLLMYI